MADEDSIRETLIEANRILSSTPGVKAALAGAGARNVYAEPRNTGDLDYAVVLDDDERYQDLLRRLRATGFELRTEQSDPPERYPSLVVLERAGIRLDLLVAKTEFEYQAVARAIDVVSKDAVLRVVRLEDLLVYKLIASRSKDWNDMKRSWRSRTGGRTASIGSMCASSCGHSGGRRSSIGRWIMTDRWTGTWSDELQAECGVGRSVWFAPSQGSGRPRPLPVRALARCGRAGPSRLPLLGLAGEIRPYLHQSLGSASRRQCRVGST